MCEITGCDVSICIYYLSCKTCQRSCALTPLKFRFHNGLKQGDQAARARHNKEKRSCEKRELILMNLI